MRATGKKEWAFMGRVVNPMLHARYDGYLLDGYQVYNPKEVVPLKYGF